MNQVKIGQFIATIRKEQQMTQLDLANKIGVTDRAVSKWENGRGLPELSLIKPLCDALSISVNEFFCGERIPQEVLAEKAEEAVIETFGYSEKRIRRIKRIVLSVACGLLAALLLVVAVFAIDLERMKNNQPIFFSTWGIDYAEPVNLQEEEINFAIKSYLMEHGNRDADSTKGVKTFVAFRTYLLSETVADTEYIVYTWVLQEQCYWEDDAIAQYGSFSMPFQFTVRKAENGFTVTDSRYPRDGSYYNEDMNRLFPKDVRKEMDRVHKDGTFERLQFQINEQIQLFFDTEQD